MINTYDAYYSIRMVKQLMEAETSVHIGATMACVYLPPAAAATRAGRCAALHNLLALGGRCVVARLFGQRHCIVRAECREPEGHRERKR